MNKILLFAALTLFFLFFDSKQVISSPPPLPNSGGNQLDAKQAEQFKREMEALQKEYGIPGMSVAVVRKQKVVFAQGFGYADLENRIPATENTPYNIASCTKPFAAVLLMKLVEEGKLDLDAPMADILKDKLFPIRYQGKEIRGYRAFCNGIRDIMQDSSSPLASEFLSSHWNYRCDRERITMRHHLTHTAEDEPGIRYQYNGDLYSYLSLVAEEASGKRFDELLVETIVRPLNMIRTVPSMSKETRQKVLADRTKYYRLSRKGDFVRAEVERPIKWPDAFKQAGLDLDPSFLVNAGAGIVSTVLDLAKFDAALDQNRIISEATKEIMFTPSRSNKGQTLPYALGWFVQDWKGKKLIWHYGYHGYYSSLILKVPAEESTLILLANSGGASAGFKLGGGVDPENVIKSPFAAAFVQRFAQSKIYPGEAWKKAKRPEELGWSSDKLAEAKAYSKWIGSAAVMIVDDGVVVDAWGDISREYYCHSMRKSLLSALYGIYVQEGKITLKKTLKELGVDDHTPLRETERRATIADLLMARSGIYLPALGESSIMKADRPYRGSHAPGTFWYYNNWDFNALGTIFDQETGEESIYSAFKRRIADPIGLQDFTLQDHRYNYESNTRHPYYGFRMSTRDLARFGLLFLREGFWQDKQILSPDWVRESTASHSKIGPNSGYGYMWWTGIRGGLFPNVNVKGHSYYASGGTGHWIIVLPYRNLVILHRVDSDKPGTEIYEFQMGTLLWLILAAAGEMSMGESPRIESAAGNRLEAEILEKILANDKLKTVIAGRDVNLSHSEDGTLALSIGRFVIPAKWWVEGDEYCNDLPSGLGGRFHVLKESEMLRLYDLKGFLFLRLAYSPD
ncbi:MAG: serine hydrolase [Phycisphaerales bacterium]|nr:MAG: serine hydrolase [Phycisphaerales bacterium]